jgi:predicted phage tail protein
MLRTIKVYGPMATFLKRRVFKADVANPAEAVRFLIANFPALERHMADQYYKVHVSDRALELGSAPDELHLPIGQQETISIIPVMAGAGAAGRIIAGVALIALSGICKRRCCRLFVRHLLKMNGLWCLASAQPRPWRHCRVVDTYTKNRWR